MRLRLFTVMCFVLVADARAQVPYGQQDIPSQRAGLMMSTLDFKFVGNAPSELVFAFTNPTYGVFYSRQEIFFSYTRGAQDLSGGDRLVLSDATMSGWAPVRPFKGDTPRKLDVFFPLGLNSDFRKIVRTKGSTEIDAFEYTVVAVGAGVGFGIETGAGYLSGYALPFFGIASRSFGNDTDTSAIVTANAEWLSRPFLGRFGVSVGYGYRWQKWYSDVGDITGDSFDYVGSKHTVRIGLSY
ncbi:MAG: hypothetical protein P8H65_05915 [Rhodothermales bacterium]|nr:hypothetical protein [Rhodothermales bacterium]MDG2017283.1 hypothetical protein [Rhodothermales bacterium]